MKSHAASIGIPTGFLLPASQRLTLAFRWTAIIAGGGTGALIAAAFLSDQDWLTAFFGFSAALALAALWHKQMFTQGAALAAGGVTYIAGFYWLPHVIAAYGSLPLAQAAPAALLFGAWGVLQFACVSLLCRFLQQPFLVRSLLSLPLAWLTCELWFPKLIPWQLGQTMLALPWLSQGASLMGAPLLSFFLLWWACGVIAVLKKEPWQSIQTIQLVSLIMLLSYGVIRTSNLRSEEQSAARLNVATIQANLAPQTNSLERWQPNIEAHRRLSRQALAEQELDLLIWPESAVGTDFTLNEKQIPDASLRHPFPDLSVPLIFGGQLLLSPSPAVPVYFSSAFLLMPSGLLAARYDKRILIPFAERKPFPGLLQRYLPHSGRPYSLETGRYRGPLAVTIGHGSKQLTFRAGLAICYEEIWPEAFWGPDRADTPQLLISLSNDAWFGSSHAAAQHQLLARWRAIELGRYLIRSTNSGVSSLIGPDGRVAAQLAPHQASYLAAKNVGLLNTATLFSRLGSMPLRAGTLFLLFLLVAALVRERAQVHHKTPRRPLPRRRKPSRYAKNMRQVRTKRINTGEHIS